jgi:(S)-citramalyl-CoA lyase
MTNIGSTRTRSWLFTPATRPDRFAKAAAAGADVAILDLEDAVAPKDKAASRTTALQYLTDAPAEGALHALRINGLDTRAGIADLDALLASRATPDFLVLPKTDSAGHLQILDRLLTAAGKNIQLIGMIESARGLAEVEAIAFATPRLAGLLFGAADMAADLGAACAWQPLAFARSQLIVACALAGVTPIDSPFFELRDEVGLKQEAATAVALGFTAKAAIHPAQTRPGRYVGYLHESRHRDEAKLILFRHAFAARCLFILSGAKYEERRRYSCDRHRRIKGHWGWNCESARCQLKRARFRIASW